MLQINASIAKHDGRIWCAYRTKNLYGYNAECFLSELDEELEPISDRPLLAENKNTAFEDVRLFSFQGSLLAFYTFMPFNEQGGWDWEYIVGFAELDVENSILKNHVSLKRLSRRFNNKGFSNEKNWSPYIYKRELFMVTDFDPFLRIIKIGQPYTVMEPKEVYFATQPTKGWEYGELRGGTPLLSAPEDGWLYGFVHSYKTYQNGFNRCYYYTAVRFHHEKQIFEYCQLPLKYPDEEPDDEYRMLWNYSNGGTLKVIFPIGLMHHKEGLLVSFGKDDIFSFIEYFSWEKIKSFFLNCT